MCKSTKAIGILLFIEKIFPMNLNFIRWELKYLNIVEKKDVYKIFIDCKFSDSIFNIFNIFILKRINIFKFPCINFKFILHKNKTVADINSDIYCYVFYYLNLIDLHNLKLLYSKQLKNRVRIPIS